jgi:FkbM family methyltransferase
MNLADAVQNPQLFMRKAVGRLRRKLARIPEEGAVVQMGGGVRFQLKRLSFLEESDLRAMMTQTYDITLCDCLRKHLSPGMIMLDVGANIGYISAVAASCVGTAGEVHGFEPLMECFERLQELKGLNPQFPLFFHNTAIGAEKGSLAIGFNPDGDMRNATLVPGTKTPQSREVPVWRLDDYIAENIATPERIGFIKIDVEGFEFPVLQGLDRFFAKSNTRPLIVCEIKPWTIQRMGHTMQDFDRMMKQFGYGAYDMVQETKSVDLTALPDMETVLFRAGR